MCAQRLGVQSKVSQLRFRISIGSRLSVIQWAADLNDSRAVQNRRHYEDGRKDYRTGQQDGWSQQLGTIDRNQKAYNDKCRCQHCRKNSHAFHKDLLNIGKSYSKSRNGSDSCNSTGVEGGCHYITASFVSQNQHLQLGRAAELIITNIKVVPILCDLSSDAKTV